LREKNVLKGVLFAILTTIIWSGNFIVARAVHEDIPPIALCLFRWSLAAVIFFPFAIKGFMSEWPLIRRHFNYFFWLALSGISLFNTFIYVAGHYTSAINLALIGTTSSPVMAIVMARIFLREKIGWQKILGILICISGILFLISKGNLHNLATLEFSKGDAWVLLAAFSFAVYNVLVKKKPAGVSSTTFLFTAIFFGTIMLIPLALLEARSAPPIAWSWSLAGVLLYLGVGASLISYLLWNKSIQLLGAGPTALFGNLIPIFSSLEAVFILHEKFTIQHVISMVVVFTGLLIANFSLFKNRRIQKPQRPEGTKEYN
jgi:drug/metabolite transporter (DMT)-like permease